MQCTIENKKNGSLFSFGITEANEEIKVLSGHLFYDKKIEVEKYDETFFIIKKLNYNENDILSKHQDKDGLIDFNSLKEDKYVSKSYKRIYEIDGYWFFIPKQLTKIVEYLYKNNLINNSKIRLTSQHMGSFSRAPIINVNYDKLFEKVTQKKTSVNAHFFCERKKDYDNKIFGDFYVLGNLKNNELQFELWEIIDDGSELFYSHFIQDLNSNIFKHFDLATHIKDEKSKIEDLLSHKMKPNIVAKIKWFRNDDNFTKEQILDITKLFFPLDQLVDEFYKKNYG